MDETRKPNESNIPTVEEVDINKISYIEVDARVFGWVWREAVTRSEVIDALEVEHSDDITKIVKPIRFKQGLFQIIADDFTRYLNKTIVLRSKEIKLIPRLKRERREGQFFVSERSERRQGTYVTIYDANDPEYRNIDHELFDQYFRSIEGVEIIIQTQPQRAGRQKTALTGHRFVVVKHTDENGAKIDLGSSIQLQGCKFNLKYDGMTKYCFLCDMKHGTECPRRVRNEFLSKLRAGKLKREKYTRILPCVRLTN